MEDSEKVEKAVERLKGIIEKTKGNPFVPKKVFQAAHMIKDITVDRELVCFEIAFGPVVKKSIKDILGNS